jgi:hypothetical protein
MGCSRAVPGQHVLWTSDQQFPCTSVSLKRCPQKSFSFIQCPTVPTIHILSTLLVRAKIRDKTLIRSVLTRPNITSHVHTMQSVPDVHVQSIVVFAGSCCQLHTAGTLEFHRRWTTLAYTAIRYSHLDKLPSPVFTTHLHLLLPYCLPSATS